MHEQLGEHPCARGSSQCASRDQEEEKGRTESDERRPLERSVRVGPQRPPRPRAFAPNPRRLDGLELGVGAPPSEARLLRERVLLEGVKVGLRGGRKARGRGGGGGRDEVVRRGEEVRGVRVEGREEVLRACETGQ